MATAADLITQFELQVSDTTELSSAEELMLLNRIYKKVCNDREWEFLKKPFTGTQSTTVPYIALPSDFAYLVPNYDYAGGTTYAGGAYVLVGTNPDPYEIIPFSDRNRYVNANNKAYIDLVNNRLVFTLQPTAANSVAFDYISTPADLTINDAPAFPARFHPIIVYGMAADDFILQLSDSTAAYQKANEERYQEMLRQMISWDARASGIM